MTIYTPKPAEKKGGGDAPEPVVVVDPSIDSGVLDFLLQVEKKDNDVNHAVAPPTLVTVSSRARRSGCANVCVLLTALVVLATGIIGGIYLYKHLAQRTFRGWCGVKYYEYRDPEGYGGRSQGHHQGDLRHTQRYYGQFEEKVEIDKEQGKYEKIDVPNLEESRRATILHDFERNFTAIVDKGNFHCFILPLNRSAVKPPRDFWDLLNKLGNGYYLPDAEIVREEYEVVYPAIYNLASYGYHIWRECRHFDTYRLMHIKPVEPRVKRSPGAQFPPDESEKLREFPLDEETMEKQRFSLKKKVHKVEKLLKKTDEQIIKYFGGNAGEKVMVQFVIRNRKKTVPL